jgi:hypothetical protein
MMNRRERKREAHWIASMIIKSYVMRDINDDPYEGDDGSFDEELKALAEEHRRKGWK